MLIHRYGHDDMHKMGGIRQNNGTFAFLFFAIVMASVALPTTSGFVGEFLLLNSVGSRNIVMAILAGLTVVFGAVYMLRAFQTMMLGTSESAVHFTAMTNTEKWVLGIVVAGTLTLGVYPNLLLDVVQKGIELYASQI
jgi:NADH-quinone oxidoreductase subunit M